MSIASRALHGGRETGPSRESALVDRQERNYDSQVDVRVDAILPRVLLEQLRATARAHPAVIRLDLAALTDIDTVGVATLRAARQRLAAIGIELELRNASPEIARTLDETPTPTPIEPRPRVGTIERIGERSRAAWRGLVALADMTFETMAGLWMAVRGRATFTGRDIIDQVERIGADSVPIVTFLSALLGLVLAFQAWVELHAFGTEQLVLEFVGIGMARGFAPFIVAVLLSGRTGSAIAAELSTMEMRQENDALRVMGISPVRHLVVPRMIALTLVVPGVSLLATAAGVLGGFGAMVGLSANWMAAVNRLLANIDFGDLWLGMVKSLLFGWVIGLVSAFAGFRSGYGPVSIGIAATRAVVWSIFAVMVVDAIVTTIWTLAQ